MASLHNHPRVVLSKETVSAHIPQGRRDVLEALARRAEATIEVIADDLVLSRSAVRQQLTALLAEGLVTVRPVPSGRGRPRNFYRPTAEGEAPFLQRTHAFLLRVLTILKEERPEALQHVLERLGERVFLAAGDLQRWPQVPLDNKLERVALGFRELGFVIDLTAEDAGSTLCFRFCPLAAVARAFPELCEVELRAMERMLAGSEVELVEHRLRGGAVCRFHIQPSEGAA